MESSKLAGGIWYHQQKGMFGVVHRRSFIKLMGNRKEPRMLPCGTPETTGRVEDLKILMQRVYISWIGTL